MRPTFYELQKFAQTGHAAKGMTGYDKMKALALFGGGFPVATLTGVDSIDFLSDGTPLISWTVIGNEQQTGAPTPSAPITPSECGDRTANLWNEQYTFVSDSISYVPIYVGDGSFTLSSTIPVSPAAASLFFLSGSVSSGASTPANGVNSGNPRTVTAINGYVTIAYRNYHGISPQGYETMLNTGSTAKPYEPYGMYKIPISCGGTTSTVYLPEPLRKIGDYADSVSSDGTVTRRIRKWVLTGNEIWYAASTGSKFYSEPSSTYRAVVDSGIVSCTCSHYDAQQNVTSGLSVANLKCAFRTNFAFYIGDDTFETANEFKTFLSEQYAAGMPVCVWYVLETAQTETVTAPTITPAKGANTLTVGTTLQPSEVSITGKIKQA